MRSAAVAVALMVSAAAPAVAETAEPDALAGRLAAAWNAKSAEAWGEQFWPDSRFVNILGQAFDGRVANAKQHQGIFESVYRDTTITMAVVANRALGPDHRLYEVATTLGGVTRLPPGATAGPDGALRSRFVLVAERRGAEWRLIFAQNTVVQPSPPPARR